MRLVNDKNQEFFLFRGIKLINSTAISANLQWRIENQNYEKTEIDLVLDTVDENDVVLEIGAGIGAVSTMILTHKKVKKYMCVEANPQLISLIKKNHRINNIDNCEIVSGVMTNDVSMHEFDFYVCDDFWESSLRKPASGCTKVLKISGHNFSEFLQRHQPSFIICDIEGGEFDLFTQGVDLSSVRKICIEVHSSSPKEYLDLYAFFVDQGLYLENPPLKEGVALFRRRKPPEERGIS